MSRVAKAPVQLPKNVQITIADEVITVKGPKGELNQRYNKAVNVSTEQGDDNVVLFAPASLTEPTGWAHAGTVRALVNNMVKGVTEGFEKTLELVGVGYRAQAAGHQLNLSLGFSHPVEYKLPKGVSAETPTNTTIILKGIDRQLVGQVASEIRSYRRPEPYKGKGIKYAGEQIQRKEAKKK